MATDEGRRHIVAAHERAVYCRLKRNLLALADDELSSLCSTSESEASRPVVEEEQRQRAAGRQAMQKVIELRPAIVALAGVYDF